MAALAGAAAVFAVLASMLAGWSERRSIVANGRM